MHTTPRNQTATDDIMKLSSMSGCRYGLTFGLYMQACIWGGTRTKHKQGRGHPPINFSGAPVPAAAGGLLSLPRRVAAYLTRALHLRDTQVDPAASTCWNVWSYPVWTQTSGQKALHAHGILVLLAGQVARHVSWWRKSLRPGLYAGWGYLKIAGSAGSERSLGWD